MTGKRVVRKVRRADRCSDAPGEQMIKRGEVTRRVKLLRHHPFKIGC